MISRYSRPELTALWSEPNRFATWLKVELAACRAMEEAGTVPPGTADAIETKVGSRLDSERILAIEKTTRHDVIAFLTHVEELGGEPARWLHLGMTSSDVLDTSLALLVRDALGLIVDGIDRLRAALKARALEHQHTPMIGRSHGMHAEPITCGLVFLRFYVELGRARDAVARAQTNIAVGKIAGAVGTYANVSPAVEGRALAALTLTPETVATQVVARDRHAEVLTALARLGAAIENIAVTVRHLQRSEVGEVEEAFALGQKGSSAMPHKKNPILAENLCGLARLLRGYAGTAWENVALWHERDISHSAVERVILPDATTLADFMVHRATGWVEGLVVNAGRMRENLERSGGLFFSEAVLLALIQTGLGRQAAYEIVQRSALAAHQGAGKFLDLLAHDPDVKTRLSTDALTEAFDLDHHLLHVDHIFARALGKHA